VLKDESIHSLKAFQRSNQRQVHSLTRKDSKSTKGEAEKVGGTVPFKHCSKGEQRVGVVYF
jgi:hypothetical protein